jgi:hypothetical protein
MAKSMKLSSMSLEVLKLCMQYFQAINHTQTSTYKEVEQSVQLTSQEVLKSASSFKTVTSEKTLEKAIFDYAGSITTMSSTTFASVNSLVTHYMSQRRWQDASHLLERTLRGIWPSLFSTNVYDITLVLEHVEECVDLVRRLAECYSIRQRKIEEEDIRVRLYRAMRSGRKVDDKLWEQVTQELLSFYTKTRQNEAGITVRQERLDDLTAHLGEQHSKVIEALWDLAELTHPRLVSIEYYQKIIRVLNGDGFISKPEVLKPILLVATELWTKGAFPEAMLYYKTFFSTFFAAPKSSPTFQDQTLMRECFDRYLECLHHTKMAFSVVHKVSSEYQSHCKAFYGASASITVQATLILARVCQESKATEAQAVMLYEELMKTGSEEVDLKYISSTLEMMHQEQAAAIISSSSSSSSSTAPSSTQVNRAVTVLEKRFSSMRETYGWAHEESLTQLAELVRYQSKQQHGAATVSRELKEATVKILSTEKSMDRLVAAASTIASSYVASKQETQATELTDELYRQMVMKDSSNAGTSHFDLSSCGRESLVFLAQLEYSLHRSSLVTLTEIMAAIVLQYTYYNEFRSLIRSKSSKFLDVSVAAAQIHQCLESSGRRTASARVLDQYAAWAAESSSEIREAGMSSEEAKVFFQATLRHLGTHESYDMIRTAGIIGNAQLVGLLNDRHYQDACNLARACFKFIAAKPETYRTTVMAKLVFTMGMRLGHRVMDGAVAPKDRSSLLETSKVIIEDVLHILGEVKINLAKLDPQYLNQLVMLLGEQENNKALAKVLKTLWESHEVQQGWDPVMLFTLARRCIVAHYVVGDSTAALRLAEHIVYNCRRVHGLYHPATLEMAVLLSQLYSSVAQRYDQQAAAASSNAKGQKAGPARAGEVATRYYRKSATVHEDILRGLSDPGYASMDGSSLFDIIDDGSMRKNSISSTGSNSPHPPLQITCGYMVPTSGEGEQKSHGQIVRQHLWLLKLALERVGGWPKGYGEYERLNADLFAQYLGDLQGFGGVEKWDLAAFGQGKAEADDDLLPRESLRKWALLSTELVQGGNGEEEL